MNPQAHSYDAIVAGGGLSGLISAQRLASSGSFSKIAICEAETKWGGRMSSFLGMSPKLFEFLLRSFGLSKDELGTITPAEVVYHAKWSHYGSGKWTELDLSKLFTPVGFKALGGLSAQKAWEELSQNLEAHSRPPEEDNLTPLIKIVGKFAKKNPAFLVLEQLAGPLGLANLLEIHGGCLQDRISEFVKGQVVLPWQKLFELIVAGGVFDPKVDLKVGSRILTARYTQGLWEVETEHATLTAPKLLVAMSPWQAIEWLPKELIPFVVLNLSLKTKPVSLVTLTKKLSAPLPEGVPPYGLIASEDATITSTHEIISFQEAVDFEHSLDAPSVTKAIKRMRRASKKFQDAFPQIQMQGEHISLKPVAWPIPFAAASGKLVRALADTEKYQKSHLAFVGDAYGASYELDENLIRSVLKAAEVLCEPVQRLKPDLCPHPHPGDSPDASV